MVNKQNKTDSSDTASPIRTDDTVCLLALACLSLRSSLLQQNRLSHNVNTQYKLNVRAMPTPNNR